MSGFDGALLSGGLLLLLGCAPRVIDIGNGGGTSVSASSGTATGAGGASSHIAGRVLLIPEASVHDQPKEPGPPNYNFVGPCFDACVPPVPPNADFLLLSNEVLSCDDTVPNAIRAVIEEKFVWEVCYWFPAGTIEVGQVALSGPVGCNEADVSKCCDGGGDCEGGDIVISELTSGSISFTIENAPDPGTNGHVSLNGDYTAPRCP
jgi:hypothetical protein